MKLIFLPSKESAGFPYRPCLRLQPNKRRSLSINWELGRKLSHYVLRGSCAELPCSPCGSLPCYSHDLHTNDTITPLTFFSEPVTLPEKRDSGQGRNFDPSFDVQSRPMHSGCSTTTLPLSLPRCCHWGPATQLPLSPIYGVPFHSPPPSLPCACLTSLPS